MNSWKFTFNIAMQREEMLLSVYLRIILVKFRLLFVVNLNDHN